MMSANIPDEEKLQNVRHKFVQGIEDKEVAKGLHEELKKEKDDNPLLLGYFGATYGLLANHSSSYFTKYSKARDAVKTLDKAIEKDPDNIELRFLRLNLQDKIPRILGLSGNMDEDKQFLIEHFEDDHHMHRDPKAMETVSNYMIDSLGIEEEEKKAPFKKYYSAQN